jgi:hypothetical protein
MAEIVSASRRTDIPAFHPGRFASALDTGEATFRAPYSGNPATVSLARGDVAAFVFWTRNPVPFLPILNRIEWAGYPSVFHFTLTGLPKGLEPAVPDTGDSVRNFRVLSRLLGPDRVLWRFDPILPGEPPGALVTRFDALSASLSGLTRRCTISLAHPYRKSVRATRDIPGIWGPPDRLREGVDRIRQMGKERGISVVSCCTPALAEWGIPPAACVDGALLRRLFPGAAAVPDGARPTRPGCLCAPSRDIGEYRTCRHGCRYCYAA